MKKSSIRFLQLVIILFGAAVLAFLLLEPQMEGRNAQATLFEIYFNDPFLLYAYTASSAFFVALYQALKLLGHIGRGVAFSEQSVKTLRIIKYCALAIVGLIAVPVAYLMIVRPGDDIAGGVMLGLMLMFISVIVATAAATFERVLQSAVDLKSENDLIV